MLVYLLRGGLFVGCLTSQQHVGVSTQGCFVGWLLNVPATCECISGTDLLRHVHVPQGWGRGRGEEGWEVFACVLVCVSFFFFFFFLLKRLGWFDISR